MHFTDNIVPISNGNIAITLLAIFMVIMQAFIAIRDIEQRWAIWGASISACIAVYSMAVFIQFNTVNVSVTFTMERIQYSLMIFLIYSVFRFTFSFLGLPLKQKALIWAVVSTLVVVIIWKTNFIVDNTVVERHLLWLDKPYIAAQLGLFGSTYVAFIACAGLFNFYIWLQHYKNLPRGSRVLFLGFLIWVLLGLHDAILTIGGNSVMFLMEYGFFAFSIAIVIVIILRFADLYDLIKKQKTELELARNELESRVQKRTEQLEAEIKEKQQLQDQLITAQKLEAIGTLASGVAHDLNNILTGLVGFPELILTDMDEDDPLRESIVDIRNTGQQAALVVQDLLTLARRGVKANRVLDLNEITMQVLQSYDFRKLSGERDGIETIIELEDEPQNILGSEIHLHKAIMNLLLNAYEATPPKGLLSIVTKKIVLEQEQQAFEDIPPDTYMRISITDTGIGISQNDLQHIFEPFYTKKHMGRSGSGLGMTVVWSTIKDHNGFIDVISQENQGTTIKLYFPVTTQQMEEYEQTEHPLKQYQGQGQHILVVDDVEQQRSVASRMLQKLSYKVDTVSSGEEAIAFLKQCKPDLVILDMIMDPGMDGYDTYLGMKNVSPDIKAIIVSGYAETERIKSALEAGVKKHILKPYSLDTIGRVILQVLG